MLKNGITIGNDNCSNILSEDKVKVIRDKIDFNKIIYIYQAFSRKKKKWILWGLYTVLFFLSAAIIFYPFISLNRGFVWYGDGLTVQYPAFVYFGEFLKNAVEGIVSGSGLPMFDFNIGMGSDIIQFLSMWYFAPITGLSAVVPMEDAELLYNILVIIRLYLIGVVFLYFCSYYKKCNIYAVAGAMIYVFGGYTLYFIKHPMFFGGLLYLPLLIVGIDKIVKTKKIILSCSFVIFISLIASYYYLYVNTLICGIYFFIRYFSLYGAKQIKNLWTCCVKICITWILGMGMAMITFLPTVLSYLNSNRRDAIISTESLFSYGEKWFRNLFVHMFSPYEDTKFWLYNGYVIIALVAVCGLFMLKKQFKTLKCSIVALIILFSMPIFTFIFYGFNSINHRWSYVAGLVLAMVCVCGLPQMQNIESRFFKWIILLGLVYTFFVVVGDYDVNLQSTYTMVACIALWITIALVLYFNVNKSRKLYYKATILTLVFCQCTVYGYYTYGEKYGNYVSEFMEAGTVNDYLLSTSANVSIDDNSFYRRETADGQKMLVNSALMAGYNGVSVCTNQQTKYVQEFNDITENRANTIAEMYDLDNRTFLETLCGVKYFTAEEGQESYVPYGFKEYETSEDVTVYKNENYLPIGFTYSSVLNQKEFEEMNPVERQEALLQGVLVTNEDRENFNNYSETQVKSNIEDVDYKVTNISGVETNGTTYNVYQDGATITFEFDPIEDAELYFRVKGFSADRLGDVDIDCTVATKINGEEFAKKFKVRSASNQYTIPGKYDYLTNLGYSESERKEITLTFPVCGEYEIKEIEIYAQKMNDYAHNVEVLKKEQFEEVEITTNTVKGKIDVAENKILYLSIPYSKGWTAYIDGNKTEIYQANAMFMAIPIEKGNHEVVLEYQTPGLKTGMVITLTSSVLFMGIWYAQKRKRKYIAK